MDSDVSSVADVPGVRVGHSQRRGQGWLSGVTVVVPPRGTYGSVDVRGGGPGTHETDALDPTTLVPTVDAVVLTGGSAYGLAAASGVQRWCEEHGRGFEVPGGVVPIVPAAAIFDLGRGGDFGARPGPDLGYAAAAAANDGPALRGNVGAGTGAAIGRGSFKGGLGNAAVRLGGPNAGVVVGAVAVVNAAGVLWAGPEQTVLPVPGAASPAGANTTIAVLVTNAVLDVAQCKRLATAGHAGMARALSPVHTLADGDTVFALSTREVPLSGEGQEALTAVIELQAAAAEALRRAILDGVAGAETVRTTAGEWPAYPRV